MKCQTVAARPTVSTRLGYRDSSNGITEWKPSNGFEGTVATVVSPMK